MSAAAAAAAAAAATAATADSLLAAAAPRPKFMMPPGNGVNEKGGTGDVVAETAGSSRRHVAGVSSRRSHG